MKNFLFLALFFLSFSLFAQSRFKVGETVQALSFSGLNLRQTPDSKGTVLTTIPYGSSVSVVEDSRPATAFSTDGLNGFWIFVSFNGKKGYVFDGYLTKMPAPAAADSWLNEYIESKFKKIGNPQINTSGNQQNEYEKRTTKRQPLNNNAVWINEEAEYATTNTLEIKGITWQEGFVLGRSIAKSFRKVSLNQTWKKDGDQWLAKQTIKEEGVAEIELIMRKDATGKIIFLNCLYMHEAGHCWLEIKEEAGVVMIVQGCVAD